MMKSIFMITAMIALPMGAAAQNGWEIPNARAEQQAEMRDTKPQKAKEIEERVDPDAPYLRGAVPEKDGKVVWTYQVEAPGKNAQEVYDRMIDYFNALSQTEGQLEGSGVSLVNKQDHIIVASMREWLTFKTSLLSLDRTKFNYRVVVTCKDGCADVLVDRMTFRYEEERNPGAKAIKAEEWISDEAAVSNKNKLYKGSAKFRRKTVDRMNELREGIRQALLGSIF